MPDNIGDLKVVSATPARAIGTSGLICVSIFRGVSTLEDIRLVGQTMERLIRAGGGRFGYLNVLEKTTSVPPAQIRQASKMLMEQIRPHVIGLAFIAEGDGFWQNIVRSMMRGMSMFQDPKPTIFSTVQEGADWLGPAMQKTGIPIDAKVLAQNTERLRAQMGSAAFMHA